MSKNVLYGFYFSFCKFYLPYSDYILEFKNKNIKPEASSCSLQYLKCTLGEKKLSYIVFKLMFFFRFLELKM